MAPIRYMATLRAHVRMWLHRLRLDERRCAMCLAPFAPDIPPLPPSFPDNAPWRPGRHDGHEPSTPPPGQGDAPGGQDAAPVRAAPPSPSQLCPHCLAMMPRRMAGFCPYCGDLFPAHHAPCTPCAHCLRETPPWRHLCFYGSYEHALRQLLLQAKFHSDPTAAHIAGGLLASVCADLPHPDAIVPVPLHTARLRDRGFNQCVEVARPISRILQAPLRPDLLARTRHTPPQTGLHRKERLRNLREAFAASPCCAGLHLLLVDDTMTTGTTLAHAARHLLAAGAASVDVAVVARTPRHFG
ncbi:ComF family protein [Nitratidesulfovibrio vulgaris]|uniref:ComF family protein n=1 Tax=Nitratidesulfovibrio vulgaris TaxID=881 RepID=UPI002301A202|nr:ComF family protein [Nitratidesulfovibrio vulgaris]WCB47327.1 ComF family protein [Nitratidesulfovibrio vulgaris]